MNKQLKLLAMACSLGFSSVALAIPTDLTPWSNEGNGSWSVAADTHSAFQSINGDPTVFYSDFNGQGRQLSGSITVETTGDDDFIGFVLGFQPGDISAAATDFILIDWKQNDQQSGCSTGNTGNQGLAISRVTGGLSNFNNAWCHEGSVNELARGTTLGNVGWNDNQTYSFDLIFNASNIQVKVDGALELNINGAFADGRFGFYNFSQSSVRYSAIEDTVAPPPPPPGVPVPAPLALIGLGLALLARKNRKAA